MAKYSRTDGVRGITGEDGYGWMPGDEGAWLRSDGPGYVLEKRRRNPKDGATDTGWYLYTEGETGFFGEWCGSRILEAVDEANRMIERANRGVTTLHDSYSFNTGTLGGSPT
jgi:hypothetical protein